MSTDGFFYDSFELQTLILVDSGPYCYVKVPIGNHCALLGSNNRGKSTILNVLKLFLLPEENFNDCANKFGFRNSEGFFSRESSYNFYFPNRTSYVVLEAANIHGPFCIVLNQGSKPFSYERTCVPVAYAELEHLFWNVHSPDNGGQGVPVVGLSAKHVADQLKKLGGEVIRDTSNIKERMYKHQHNRPDAGRFCLLPLKSGGAKQADIDAWKRLIHLSFDIGSKDKRTLPETIATIIEGRMSRSNAELNVNFGDILARYENLRGIENRIQTIKNGAPWWDEYDRAFVSLESKSQELYNTLLDVEQSIQQAGATHYEQRRLCHDAYQKAKDKVDGIRQRAADNLEKYNMVKGQVVLLTKTHASAQKDSLALGNARSGYGSKSLKEIIEVRQEDLTEQESLLRACKDQAEHQKQFEQVTRSINRHKASIESLESWFENKSLSVLDMLSPDTASKLFTLNPKVFSVQVSDLSSTDRQALEGFGALLAEHEGLMTFLSQTTDVALSTYDAAQLLEAKKVELDTLKGVLRKDQARAASLSAQITNSPEKNAQRLLDLEDQYKKSDVELKLLLRADNIVEKLEETRRELAVAKENLAMLEERGRDDTAELTSAQASLDEASAALERAKALTQHMQQWESRVYDQLQTRLAFLQRGIKSRDRENLVVTQEMMDGLEQRVRGLISEFQAVSTKVSNLLDAVPLDGDSHEQAHLAVYDLLTLRNLHDSYAILYGRLGAEEEKHYNEILAHNTDTNIQMKQISAARNRIATFICEIEDHLKTIKVSNLAEIRVEYKLHPQFDELLSTVDTVNTTSGTLPAAALYERIGSFCAQFFGADARKNVTLKLNLLIASVEYRVRLDGRDDFSQEGQSTGTSLMINCRVLAFLLKELLQADTRVSMPLFIDELANLDDKNLRAAREIADSDGFVVFGATPNMTPSIGKILGRFLNLDYFNATEGAYDKTRTVLYTGVTESLVQRGSVPVGGAPHIDADSPSNDAETETLEQVQ